jgi:F0F1-type ATP synthase membrane subunit b/b'
LDQNVSNVLESKVKLIEHASIFNKFGYMFNYFFSFIIILLFIARALWKKLKN